MTTQLDGLLERLRDALTERDGGLAVAVSGGVDSMTLAAFAHRLDGSSVRMFHAVSAAVPPQATQRVRSLARDEGWDLRIVEPDEFAQESYVSNPTDRCLHCKRSLYTRIREHTPQETQLFSGANLDDLADYRPGLVAAAEAQVRHPWIEAGIDKEGVRAVARRLGLGLIAELPASPCLSSRVQSGIRIVPRMLRVVDDVEQVLRKSTGALDLRCRVRRDGVVLEMDAGALARLELAERERIADAVRHRFEQAGYAFPAPPAFETYRMGSSFVHAGNHR